MALKAIYKVVEDSEIIARFVYLDDALFFAEKMTLNGERTLSVHDISGWVDVYYSNGYTTNIK